MRTKVTDLHLYPDHTVSIRQLNLDDSTAMKALMPSNLNEVVLVRPGSIKFNPQPIVLRFSEKATAWEQLEALPDPVTVIPKKVSGWAYFTGDNPFLSISSAGSIVPMPDRPGEKVSHSEVLRQYSEIEQAAIDSKGIGAVARQNAMMSIQVILAGICALAAILAAVAMVPRIMENFK